MIVQSTLLTDVPLRVRGFCSFRQTTPAPTPTPHLAPSLCSFSTRQSAHDWIVKHRLSLARHYLMDPRLSPSELQATATADGCDDEYYLGEHTSLEIIQVPQYQNADKAPDCSVQNLLFSQCTSHRDSDSLNTCEVGLLCSRLGTIPRCNPMYLFDVFVPPSSLLSDDHFITNRREEEYEEECAKQDQEQSRGNPDEDKVIESRTETHKSTTTSPKIKESENKRRKLHV